MRCIPFLIIAVILSACAGSLFQSSSEDSTPSADHQTTGAIPEIRFERPTATATIEGVEEVTASNRAFENNRPLAARVNNQPIFLDTFEKQVAQFGQALMGAQGTGLAGDERQEALAQVRRQVLETLIDRVIIEQEANRLGITITEELLEARTQESVAQGQSRVQFEQWLAANNLTYQEFKETLRYQLIANQMFEHITRNAPKTADQIQVRQILVTDEATARTIIEQLKNGADFSLLAQAQSLPESGRTNGGEPGWFPRGLSPLPAEVEAIAFSLSPGQISGPIRSSLGFHIIKLENREAQRPLTTEMLQALKEKMFTDWLTEQRSVSVIESYVAF